MCALSNHHSSLSITIVPSPYTYTHTQILTYNVWVAPLVRWNPSENLAKICAFIQEQQADVICMQEVYMCVCVLGVVGASMNI